MSNFNFNEVILGGRLTADPEQKQTPSGVAVCNFSIAVNRKYSNSEQQTDFINCQAWRGTAEFISKYFGKGSAICIRGSIQTRTWNDNNGNKRYATEVVVDEAMFVDGKNDTQSAEATDTDKYTAPAFKTPVEPNFEDADTDDSLPF